MIKKLFINENIFVLWLTTFTTMLGIGLIAPIMSIYAKTLGASNLEVGLIFGSFALARTIAQIPIGYLSDIYGKKIFIVIGTFFCSVFTTLYAFVNSIFMLVLIRMLNGAFSSFITPVAGAYISLIAPKNKLGEYMGIFGSSISLGFAFGPLIGGFLAQYINMRAPFYFCGIITFIAFLICLFKLKNVYVKNDEVIYINKLIIFQKKNISKKKFNLKYLKDKNFLIGFILNLFYTFNLAGIMSYFAIYASKYISLFLVGFLISYTNFLSGILQKIFGRMYDKVGNILILISVVLISLGIYSLSFSKTLALMFFSITLISIGGAIFSPSINALTMKNIPYEKKGMAMGLFTTSLNIGIFLGAVILGFVADKIGLANMYKDTAIFFMIIGITGYIFIKKIR